MTISTKEQRKLQNVYFLKTADPITLRKKQKSAVETRNEISSSHIDDERSL